MMNIVIHDNDKQYMSTLGILLQKYLPEAAFCVSDITSDHRTDDTVIITSDAGYISSHPGFKSIMLSDGPTEMNHDAVYRCSRYPRMEDLCSVITSLFDDTDNERPCRVVTRSSCITGNASPAEISAGVVRETDLILKQGLIPVIAEICPGHCLVYPRKQDENIDTFSDLMLRIFARSVSSSELGIFMYPLDEGILRMRPFTRTDDIYECSPDDFRMLSEMLIEWNKRNSNVYYMLLVVYNVPFSLIYTVATLSDKLILINAGDDFRTAEFNREISSLLRNLPDSCEIQQSRIQASDACKVAEHGRS